MTYLQRLQSLCRVGVEAVFPETDVLRIGWELTSNIMNANTNNNKRAKDEAGATTLGLKDSCEPLALETFQGYIWPIVNADYKQTGDPFQAAFREIL